jgi:hypothetical protein
VAVDFELDDALPGVHCVAQVETFGRTGVEMEALTAVQVGLLTVYDMCKAVDRGMVITDVSVREKRGGKSGIGRRRMRRVEGGSLSAREIPHAAEANDVPMRMAPWSGTRPLRSGERAVRTFEYIHPSTASHRSTKTTSIQFARARKTDIEMK